ncbi:MAG: phosphotyrosine protein phosphatase [Nitrospirota bacterium]|nr:phosphotyrosine protein phosphatase [Nitrospirota bacterium]
MHLLFVCGKNRRRSPTAADLFADLDGVETASAGLQPDADCVLSADLIQWADLIFVMEPGHRSEVQRRFKDSLGGRRVVVLGIPDRFQKNDPTLIHHLHARVPRWLPRGTHALPKRRG